MSLSDLEDQREQLRSRLDGTNIHPDTFLATDYLNHFNELVMLLDLVAEMPDMLDEAKAWAPCGYAEHFAQSTFKDRDLAIAAYNVAPEADKDRFDRAVDALNETSLAAVAELDAAIAAGASQDELQFIASNAVSAIGSLIDKASAAIHGHEATASQDEIDRLLAG